MDNLDAPQWADFIGPSPQICLDDYFLRKHVEHEYREKSDSMDSDSPNMSVKKNDLSKQSFNESVIQKTPIRTKYLSKGNKSSSCRKNKLKETTYENVLMEAMSNLKLSIKNQLPEKTFNKSCLIDSPAFKTPIKRITRSMCAKANMETPNNDIKDSEYFTPMQEKPKIHKYQHLKENKENIENNDIEKHKNSVNQETSQMKLEDTLNSTKHETSEEKSEPEIKEENSVKKIQSSENELPKSKVVTSFSTESVGSGSGLRKKVTALTGNAWHRQVKRRMSITNQRRLSVAKPLVQNKYISMAEAVTNFHRVTPQRFRTTTVKNPKTEQLRRMSFKLTRATSPALICKNRSRPIRVLSREEQERIELEEIRQNQIKANPVRKNILLKPAPLKKVEKKMITYPEPFHLTETKKYQSLQKPQQNQETKRIHRTKTVPSIVSTDDQGVIVKDEEVLHFGIPLEPCKTKKKNTKVIPFSFEARNKVLQNKKEEKLKIMLEMEKKSKPEFHARPVPATLKTPLIKKLQKDNFLNKPKITIARSTSFEERYKQLQLKKEEKIKQLLEEEKKARTFKAQKVPQFKPVLIRGRSRDNLLKKSQENLTLKRSQENLVLKKSQENLSLKKSQENRTLKSNNVSGNFKKTDNALKKSQENLALKQKNFIKKPLSIPFIAPKKSNSLPINIENQENQCQNTVPKILEPKFKLSQKSVAVLTELNTDIRAKQRREFDEQIKRKEMEEKEMKRREEEQRILKEKAQKLELRKMTEIKARPMPVYKPMNIVKSNKPLTDAHSPAWAKRKGSTH